MIDKSKVIKDLEEILNKSIDPSMFPYKKGNSIRIGKYVVRSNSRGHKVFDCEENCMIAQTFSKASALALAKTMSYRNSQSSMADILNIDRCIEKWYNDCVFHNHTLKITKDAVKAEVAETRYDIARHQTDTARAKLDKYIYS